MSNMFSILREHACAIKGHFSGLKIRTKSGDDHYGTLARWSPDITPQVVCLVEDGKQPTYVEISSIESIRIINPAQY